MTDTKLTALKWSPLCTRHEGREVYFTVSFEGHKKSVTFPSAFLDAACGHSASEADRRSWVSDQRRKLVSALSASQPVPNDLSHVLIEEIA